jgi:hypothetical protein
VNYKHISLPIEGLEELARASGPRSTKCEHYNLKGELPIELVNRLLDIDFHIHHVEVFFTPPKTALAVHSDGAEPSRLCKLNWVFGGERSKMLWWKCSIPGAAYTTGIGTPYLHFDPRKCVPIESVAIQQPTLVCVGVPHSVANMGDQDRYCLSVVLADKDLNLITFEEAVVRLP